MHPHSYLHKQMGATEESNWVFKPKKVPTDVTGFDSMFELLFKLIECNKILLKKTEKAVSAINNNFSELRDGIRSLQKSINSHSGGTASAPVPPVAPAHIYSLHLSHH